jgi:hypothetical protein
LLLIFRMPRVKSSGSSNQPSFSCCCSIHCWFHQGGRKPVHIKMTLFGLYLIQYQPHLSIFESFWFDKESKIWKWVCD